MNQETKALFQTLTQLPGAPGNEHQVRAFMKQELAKYADDIVQDRLGSVFGVRRGAEDAPRIMVAGHMDEVGFMVTSITDNGLLRFQTLGGWWSQVLLAQRVEIQTDNEAGSGCDFKHTAAFIDRCAAKPSDGYQEHDDRHWSG